MRSAMLVLLALEFFLSSSLSFAQITTPWTPEDDEGSSDLQENQSKQDDEMRGFIDQSTISLFTDYASTRDLTGGLAITTVLDKLSKIGLSAAKSLNLEDSTLINTLDYQAYLQRKLSKQSQLTFNYRHVRQKREFNTHRLALTYLHSLENWEFELSPEFRFIIFGQIGVRDIEVNTSNSGLQFGVTALAMLPWEFSLRYAHYFYDFAARNISGLAASNLSNSGYLYSLGFLRARAAAVVVHHFQDLSLDLEYSLGESFVDGSFSHSAFLGGFFPIHQRWTVDLRLGASKAEEQDRIFSVGTSLIYTF